MRMPKFLSLALAALSLMAVSAPAQSGSRPPKMAQLRDLLLARLHIDPHAKGPNPRSPVRDAVALGLAQTKTYKFASADFPGASISFVDDENHTTVVGFTEFGSGAFTLNGNQYRLLDFAPGISVGGINTSGQIVGNYRDVNGVVHGFVDTAGVITNIDVPGASTFAAEISDTGEIVGDYIDNVTDHGFFTLDGVTFTTIDFPGALLTQAAGVNASGDVVGTWLDSSGGNHGFLLRGGVLTSLDFPLAIATFVGGINDAGVIAGSFVDAGGVVHGFVYSHAFYQVDVAGAGGTALTRIKNNGRVTGSYRDQSGEVHGLTGR